VGLRDLAKRAIKRAVSGGAAPSSPPPVRVPPAGTVPPVHEAHVAGPASPPPSDHETDRAEKPWYLQGQEDVEGWDQSNPGDEPGKKNLRP